MGIGVLDEGSEELSTVDIHDNDIVAEDGEVSSGDWERSLGESRAGTFDVGDGVVPIVKTEDAQQTVGLEIWLRS